VLREGASPLATVTYFERTFSAMYSILPSPSAMLAVSATRALYSD
jgi:hypothetical protein